MTAAADTLFRLDVVEIRGEPVIVLELAEARTLGEGEPGSFPFSVGRAHELVGALMVALANARGQLERRRADLARGNGHAA
jgi:hypothetical protein